ncbi:hypothetical protein KL86DYS1_12090 [uncultured Dysgonomonas sp.]|uniref:Uncharacterized protein n=1 Tax=uncultured Dysgonomonas sp. TaxID=206096 RepID=A0A212JFD0_9BACT|nr:hypothetical protein KL86DYS1_12090 [uncultured Dysgonomonas sp.]
MRESFYGSQALFPESFLIDQFWQVFWLTPFLNRLPNIQSTVSS